MQNRSIPLSEWIANADRGEGFMVAVKGAGAPGMVHPTIDGAEAEGRRLIAGLPTHKDQTAMVLRVERILRRGAALIPGTETIVDRPVRKAITTVSNFGVEVETSPGKFEAVPRGFIPWAGGSTPPVPLGTEIRYVLRGGLTVTARINNPFRWEHQGGPSDIVGYQVVERPDDETPAPEPVPAPVPASKPAEYFTGEFVKWTRDTGEIAYGYAVGPHRVITSGGERLDVEVLRLNPGQPLGADMPTKGDYIIPTSMLSLDLRTVAGGGWRTLRVGYAYVNRAGLALRIIGAVPGRYPYIAASDDGWNPQGFYEHAIGDEHVRDMIAEVRADA